MPIKLRRTRRVRVVRKSKPWYRKKYSALELASKAYQATRYIRGMINCEKHYYDINSSAAPNTSGTMVHLSNVSQGDDRSNRQGTSILARSIYIRTNTENNASATNTFLRMVIFWDKFNTGTPPVGSDVIPLCGSTHATVGPLAINKGQRFQILYDKVYNLPNTARNSQRNIFIPLYKHIKYTGSAGTDEYNNQLYILFVSNETTYVPNVTYSTRLGFYDN